MDELNNRMEGTEGRIRELKDKIIQITKSELHRENILKKKTQKNLTNRASGTHGTVTRIPVNRAPEKERKREEVDNVSKERIAENFPN